MKRKVVAAKMTALILAAGMTFGSGFADGGINCTGSSAGSYNVALF